MPGGGGCDVMSGRSVGSSRVSPQSKGSGSQVFQVGPLSKGSRSQVFEVGNSWTSGILVNIYMYCLFTFKATSRLCLQLNPSFLALVHPGYNSVSYVV